VSLIEVAIGPSGPETFSVEVVRSPAGEAAETIRLDVESLLGQRSSLQQALLASAVPTRRVLPDTEQPVRDVGQLLFVALLGTGTVAEQYRVSAAVTAQNEEELRVVLRIDTPALASLPWEAMYDQVTGTYVCRKNQLVRHVPVASAPAPLQVQPPLRILGVVSSPQGLPLLDVDRERDQLAQALVQPIRQGLVEIHWAPSAAWADLQDLLQGGKWHAVHFIGHGDYDPRRDEGLLALTREDGRVDMVAAHRFIDLLRQGRPMPRLIVLNTCSGGATGVDDLFSGTATTLIRGGVSAVAAMQYAISDKAAVAFARGFYLAIAHGRGVDEAVSSGRVAILGTSDTTLEWVTPVLYLRGQDAHLFTLPSTPDARHPTKDGDQQPSSDPAVAEDQRAHGGVWPEPLVPSIPVAPAHSSHITGQNAAAGFADATADSDVKEHQGVAKRAYFDLDVLFDHSGTGYKAQVVRSPAGEGQAVTFSRPFTDLELENFVLKVGQFRTRTRRSEAAPVAAAKEAGGRLFDAVFSGVVGECLRRSSDAASSEQAALRIRLRLADCQELAVLPWELLYDRSDDWFLALSDRTPVIRYVQLPERLRPVPVTLPLRILVIKSEPADWPSLDLAAEWSRIAQALEQLTGAGLITYTELPAPTLGELRRALQDDTFHVLHYMGHGAFDPRAGGTLQFTDRAGYSTPVTASDLGIMLRDHTSLRAAVINACEGGRTDPTDPFAGVADTLVRRGVPAVIAMQFEVSDYAAAEFASALYGALASAWPIDSAVAEARKAMYAVSPLEWATPVLYLRADDARLFDIPQHALISNPRSSQATSAVTYPLRSASVPGRPPATRAGMVLDVSDRTFGAEVIRRSRTRLVLVYLWARWCRSCGQLDPMLERLANDAGGAWVLAKIDVDANPESAELLQVKSIPMVKALIGGQVVDGFLGVLPEAELSNWIGRMLQTARQLGLP
jgi:CHAT domain-containing protein/thiol-disulfide isomerase/thioredoxin